MKEQESREAFEAPHGQKVSDSSSAGACDDTVAAPQQRKQEKIVARVRAITGAELPFFMADAVNDAVRTGLRITDKAEEEEKGYAIHCCAEYHMARMSGKGAGLVFPLYSISLRIANDSKNFFISIQEIARVLGIRDDDGLYGAASLLAASGFWIPTERKIGKATKYRPLTHSEWTRQTGGEMWYDATKNEDVFVGKYCTVKSTFPFIENTPEYRLGRKLHGITGEKFFGGVLKGWLKSGTEEQLANWAKDFMQEDTGEQDGISRRIRLGNHFREMAART